MTRTHIRLAIGLAAISLSLVGSVPTAAQTVAPAPTATAAPPADAASPDDPAPIAEQPTSSPDFGFAPGRDVREQEHQEDRGADNIVDVYNFQNNQFRMRGSVDMDHVAGDTATPTNRAQAFASCSDCQTFAVALQIALIRSDATDIAPVNQAISINQNCTSCYTSARALQYVFLVDDPQQIPGRANQLISRMNQELRAIARQPNMSPAEANARIDVVVAQFADVAGYLKDQRQDADQPNQNNDSGRT